MRWILSALTVYVCFQPGPLAGAMPLELLASDGKAFDSFGYSAHLHNNLAFVAAAPDLTSFDGSVGSVYLFDARTGQEMRQFSTPDAEEDGGFGKSIDSDGSEVIIGAIGRPLSIGTTGAAYVFDVVTGTQLRTLVPSEGGNQRFFGVDVALNSTHYLVGSEVQGSGGFEAGAAYLFDRATGAEQKLVAPDASPLARFGDAVAINEQWAVIGAPGDHELAPYGGSAYVVDLSNMSLKKLRSPTPRNLGGFGTAVDVDGNRVLVTSIFETRALPASGVAYVFDASTGALLQELVPNGQTPVDTFGESAALSGNFAVVGAVRDSQFGENSGAVYLFDVATGEQLMKWTLPMPSAQDAFGWSVSISGNRVLATAVDRDGRAINAGAAYVLIIPEPTTMTLGIVMVAGCFTLLRPSHNYRRRLTRRWSPRRHPPAQRAVERSPSVSFILC